MQLFAFDENSKIVYALEAESKKTYYCPECGDGLRLRAGVVRQRHFYHTQIEKKCRQSGKTLEHIQTQLFLQKTLDCVLEYRFDSIKRIADAVCFKRKLIFEVQCSPITAEEIEMRNLDYASLGYQVIWILHQKRFNRKSCAQTYLKDHPHYFTDINEEGRGKIYDQFSRRFKIFTVDLTQHFEMPEQIPHPLNRFKKWPLYFAGDYCEYFLNNPNSALCQAALHAEQKKKRLWYESLFEGYRLLFRFFLERACR